MFLTTQVICLTDNSIDRSAYKAIRQRFNRLLSCSNKDSIESKSYSKSWYQPDRFSWWGSYYTTSNIFLFSFDEPFL